MTALGTNCGTVTLEMGCLPLAQNLPDAPSFWIGLGLFQVVLCLALLVVLIAVAEAALFFVRRARRRKSERRDAGRM